MLNHLIVEKLQKHEPCFTCFFKTPDYGETSTIVQIFIIIWRYLIAIKTNYRVYCFSARRQTLDCVVFFIAKFELRIKFGCMFLSDSISNRALGLISLCL